MTARITCFNLHSVKVILIHIKDSFKKKNPILSIPSLAIFMLNLCITMFLSLQPFRKEWSEIVIFSLIQNEILLVAHAPVDTRLQFRAQP